MENTSLPPTRGESCKEGQREQPPSEDGFDFSEWVALARTDPEVFARRRLALIQAAIESTPERDRERLKGLQFRIDCERRLARTPLKACLRLSSMMWDSFFTLNEGLTSLSEKAGGERKPVVRIIPFKRP